MPRIDWHTDFDQTWLVFCHFTHKDHELWSSNPTKLRCHRNKPCRAVEDPIGKFRFSHSSRIGQDQLIGDFALGDGKGWIPTVVTRYLNPQMGCQFTLVGVSALPGVPELRNEIDSIFAGCSNDLLDQLQRHVESTEPNNEPCSFELTLAVLAVTSRSVDMGRDKEALTIVEAKRLDRES